MAQRRPGLACSALALLTAACGGGGSSGPVAGPGTLAAPVAPVPVTPPAPSPAPAPAPAPVITPADLIASPRPASRSANDTNEFRTNYNASELIGLLYAADAGITGRGVTVGIVDEGFHTAAPDLAGRQSSLSRDFGRTLTKNPDGSYTATARNDVGAEPSSNHGTLVAELLAGVRDGRGGIGVAADASLAYLRVDDVKPLEPNSDGTINSTITSSNIAAAIAHAADVRLRIVSVSLGITGGGSPSLTGAIDRLAASGGLLVIAAGNDGGANPESIQLLSPANRASWISVGGLSTATDAFALDTNSARAGSVADRYLVAAYENIAADPLGTGFFRFRGTSGAVPQVAAAAALVLQKWPQLSGRQAGDVLLATARDIGSAGTDTIFGRGLLDLRAALSPVDPVLVTTSGATTPLTAASLALPAAAGTGAITRLLATTVILDRFGRDFAADARGLLQQPGTIGAVAGAMRPIRRSGASVAGLSVTSDIAFAAGPVRAGEPVARFAGAEVRAQAGSASVAFTTGYAPWSGAGVAGIGAPVTALAAYAPAADAGIRTALPFARGALSFAAATGTAAAGRTTATARVDAAGIGWTDGRWSVGGGVVAESGSLFGARSAGPLRLGSGADTGFVEGRYDRGVGGWSLSGYGSLGVTGVRAAAESLLTAPSTLVTSRFGVEAARMIGAARVAFGVAQPLNVERGAATLTLADGYSRDARALTFAAHRVDLRGERQLLAQAGLDLGPFRLGVVHGMLRAETGVVTRLDWRF